VADGTRFTYRRIRKILRGIRLGLSHNDSAALARVEGSTLDGWRLQDPRFAAALKRADAWAVAVRVKTIQDTADWRAAAWWLERRRNEEFGRRTADDAALGQVRPESPMARWEAEQSTNGTDATWSHEEARK